MLHPTTIQVNNKKGYISSFGTYELENSKPDSSIPYVSGSCRGSLYDVRYWEIQTVTNINGWWASLNFITLRQCGDGKKFTRFYEEPVKFNALHTEEVAKMLHAIAHKEDSTQKIKKAMRYLLDNNTLNGFDLN